MYKHGINSFLDIWGEKWASLPQSATVQDRRKRFEVIAQEMRSPTPDRVETDKEHLIKFNSLDVRVREFGYADDKKQPCLIYLHGVAGW